MIPLVCAPRCLCSRSLACATSFPLPVQPMLIITRAFQTPTILRRNIRTSKSISGKMTQLMAFPTTVSLCLKEKRNGSPDSCVPVAAQKITGTNVSIQKRDRGVLDCVYGGGKRAAYTHSNLLICFPGQIMQLFSQRQNKITLCYFTYLCLLVSLTC